MTETLQQRIQRHEGIRLHPYIDTTGNATIGYGHKIPEIEASNYPDGCTLDDAMNWLYADIQKAIHGVQNALPWSVTLSDLRQQVLYEMAFQLGVTGLLGFHNMLAYTQQGHYDIAASHMLESKWHEQTPNRCEELANIMLNGSENA